MSDNGRQFNIVERVARLSPTGAYLFSLSCGQRLLSFSRPLGEQVPELSGLHDYLDPVMARLWRAGEDFAGAADLSAVDRVRTGLLAIDVDDLFAHAPADDDGVTIAGPGAGEVHHVFFIIERLVDGSDWGELSMFSARSSAGSAMNRFAHWHSAAHGGVYDEAAYRASEPYLFELTCQEQDLDTLLRPVTTSTVRDLRDRSDRAGFVEVEQHETLLRRIRRES